MAGSRSQSPAPVKSGGLPLAVRLLAPLALVAALSALAVLTLASGAGRTAADEELDRRAAVVQRAWETAGSPRREADLRALGRRLRVRISIVRRGPSPAPAATQGDFRTREFAVRGGRALRVAVPAKAVADRLSEGRTAALVAGVAGVAALLLVGWLLLQRLVLGRIRALEAAVASHAAQVARPASDAVTGLPHARAFREAIAMEVKRSVREQVPLTLVVVDLDDFKLVNERHGKETGDDVLRGVGEQIRSALRATDTIGRLGGDEFGILLPKANAQQTQIVLERARAAVAAAEENVAAVSFSAGYACYPQDAREPGQLLQAAEVAARSAADAGGGQNRRFDAQTSSVSRNEGERAEVEALISEPGAVTPVFQPLVALATGQVSGYEALSRFRQPPQRRPDEWFLLAQRVGLGGALEAHAIKLALETPNRPAGTYLSINLSPSTISTPEVQAVLPADLTGLVIEVTEHELAADTGVLQSELAVLRERGARIAVDDAGAGYAGLQQLMRVQPDLIKLDRSLVQNLDADPAKQALVDSFVRFGRRTGAQVVAEGIETEEELRTLADLDVNYGQGYFLSKPAPPWAQISPWVAEKLMARSLGGALAVDIDQLPEGGDQRLAAVCARVARVSSLSELDALNEVIGAELGADDVVMLMRSSFDGGLAALNARSWLPASGRLDLSHFPELNGSLASGQPAQFLLGRGSGTTTGMGEVALLANSGYQTMLAVPVVAHGEAVGLMLGLADTERPWGRQQTNRAFVIAYQLGPVLAALATSQTAASTGG